MTISETIAKRPGVMNEREFIARTAVLVLTYGNRVQFLSQVVERLIEIGPGQILVVSNDASPDTNAYLAKMSDRHPNLEKLLLERNVGSSGGYTKGMEHLLERHAGIEFVWFLDDDNLPNPDALQVLFRFYREMHSEYTNNGPALLAFRPQGGPGKFFSGVLEGTALRSLLPLNSSFLGFHFLAIPQKLRRQFDRAQRQGISETRALASHAPVSECCWGGLLLSRSLIERVGFPLQDLYIYRDDVEYTMRLSKVTDIMLLRDAVVADLIPTWHMTTKGNRYVRTLESDSGIRVYYYVRNDVWLDKHVRMRSRFIYRINRRLVFMLFRLLVWAGKGDPKRLKLIHDAIRDGESGRLGMRQGMTF